MRLLDLHMSSERNEASDDHDQQNDHFEDTQDVLKVQAIADTGAVQEEGECDRGETHEAARPLPGVFLIGRTEDVFAEDDGVTRCPACMSEVCKRTGRGVEKRDTRTEENGVRAIRGRDEEFGAADKVFEVVLFPAVTRDGLEVTVRLGL
jgi:hypothetical protein